jgi:hypothetical protein
MTDTFAAELIRSAFDEVSKNPTENRFVTLLESGAVPRERLTWLAGEQNRIISSDRRSFTVLAARFPEPPAGPMFLDLARGESQALILLTEFSAALGWESKDLKAYEPQPLAQAYPAFLAWCALNASSSAVALAMIANLDEWGGYCARIADALISSYGLPEPAVAFFRFFAAPPPDFADQAISVIAAGLAAGEDPDEALRTARLLHAYELAFWTALAQDLDQPDGP